MASDSISAALSASQALPLPRRKLFGFPQGKPWALPPSGLAVFYGRPETPRLFHYFLPRLLGGREAGAVPGWREPV